MIILTRGRADVGNPSQIFAMRRHINVLQNISNLRKGRGVTTSSAKKRFFSVMTQSNKRTKHIKD